MPGPDTSTGTTVPLAGANRARRHARDARAAALRRVLLLVDNPDEAYRVVGDLLALADTWGRQNPLWWPVAWLDLVESGHIAIVAAARSRVQTWTADRQAA